MKRGIYEILVRRDGKPCYTPIDGYVFKIDGYSFGCTNKQYNHKGELEKKSCGWTVTHLKSGLVCTPKSPRIRADVIPAVRDMLGWFKDHEMPIDEEWTDEDTEKWCGGIYR